MDQSLRAKVLLQMKDSEIAKLRFVEGRYKPFEHEKWIMSVNRSMKGFHPEIGHYWEKVSKEVEETYCLQYLKDSSPTRVSLQPRQKLDGTEFETIIENRMRTLLMNAVPTIVTQQCMFQEDLTCIQVIEQW